MGKRRSCDGHITISYSGGSPWTGNIVSQTIKMFRVYGWYRYAGLGYSKVFGRDHAIVLDYKSHEIDVGNLLIREYGQARARL